jgi:hypothetical protein
VTAANSDRGRSDDRDLARTAARQNGRGERRYGLREHEGRERANERQGKMRGARGLHLGARTTWAGRGVWASFDRARGACHGRGRDGCGGGDGSDKGGGKSVRASPRERAMALTGRSHRAEREGELASGTWRRQARPIGQRERERERGRTSEGWR